MFDTLAIDWGTKRYGLSYGDSSTCLVIPDHKERYTKNIFTDLEQIFSQKPITSVIVGVPTNFNLQPTKVTKSIQNFVQDLQQKFPRQKIITINERGTTKEASQTTLEPHSLNHLSATNILTRHYANKSNK